MKKTDFQNRYHDIINLPHHVSATRPHMSRLDRAAQFSPFAALNGYTQAIREASRFTQQRVELGEYELTELNESFRQLMEHFSDDPEVKITYFQPEKSKEEGLYLTVKTKVIKIDEFEREILLKNGTKIPFSDLYSLTIEQESAD